MSIWGPNFRIGTDLASRFGSSLWNHVLRSLRMRTGKQKFKVLKRICRYVRSYLDGVVYDGPIALKMRPKAFKKDLCFT